MRKKVKLRATFSVQARENTKYTALNQVSGDHSFSYLSELALKSFCEFIFIKPPFSPLAICGVELRPS